MTRYRQGINIYISDDVQLSEINNQFLGLVKRQTSMPDKRQNRRPKNKNLDKKSSAAGPGKGPEPVTKTDSSVSYASVGTGPSTSTDKTEDIAARYESELVWCIEQLQIGISNDKTGGKKAQDAVKILKILENPKAPLIKKRQAMRSAFGDYRRKMEEDEKKYSTNVKKMKIEAVTSPDQAKSVVYRKSHTTLGGEKTSPAGDTANDKTVNDSKLDVDSSGNNEIKKEGEEQIENVTTNTKFNLGQSDSSFKFNFAHDDSKTVDNDVESETDTTKINSKTAEPSLNYYKMESSTEKFTFNFFESNNS